MLNLPKIDVCNLKYKTTVQKTTNFLFLNMECLSYLCFVTLKLQQTPSITSQTGTSLRSQNIQQKYDEDCTVLKVQIFLRLNINFNTFAIILRVILGWVGLHQQKTFAMLSGFWPLRIQ